ncbi:MAG: ribosome biogenesis GTPase Der [Pseudomonadales bacterium]|nr:ribosome biogenesis GTPase Der [Pseudomonadales bacterium]
MLPVVALVGRPNVGKSTLFNRLTQSRDALVADFSGLTRDRRYGEARFEERRFLVIDTGGITGQETGIDAAMAAQSFRAIDEADAIFFLVDCHDGLTAVDEEIAARLRQGRVPVYLVANKVDGTNPDLVLGDFHRLGFSRVFPVTATGGRGIRTLLGALVAELPPPEPLPEALPEGAGDSIRVAVVGRPNVGKSTLVNRLLGEERVVVYDQPGTTRDSIYIDYVRDGVRYTLIDTAGVRRRKSVELAVEKFSIVKTLQAIDDAQVTILLVDASEGLVDQDLHLLGYCLEAGRALVLAVNKWDGLAPERRDWLRRELERRLRFADFVDVHFISALHGSGVGGLYPSLQRAHRAATDQYGTARLTRILHDAVATHPPPMVRGRRIKPRFAHLGGRNPPLVVIHGTQVEQLPNQYLRYLEKAFRRGLDLHGTPVRIELKSPVNPYAGRKNELTPRQIARKRRAMAHYKSQR